MKPMRFVQMFAVAVVMSVLSLNAWGQTYQVIYNFAGGTTDGANPIDAGALAFDGTNLYGTTKLGGACGLGTLFELSPNGSGGWTETVVHSFCGVEAGDGAYPTAAPAFVFPNEVLGSTTFGGTSGEGTIYIYYVPGGALNIMWPLHCATSPAVGNFGGGCFPYTTPSYPAGAEASGPSATFYGGGAYSHGLMDYLYNNFYSFCLFSGCPDGSNPGSALTFDSNFNAYGTTRLGGASDQGVVYECVAQPDFTCVGVTVLHSFAGGTNDGAYPFLATLADTGESCSPTGLCSQTILGTTPFGGASSASGGLGYGTVFNISANGFSLVHSFDFYDGAYPYAGLTNLNGTFYGTTSAHGPYQRECCPLRFLAGRGTIYSLTPTGTLTTLHTFTGPDGANPYSGLVADANGNLYGVTYAGGAHGYGVVYEITP